MGGFYQKSFPNTLFQLILTVLALSEDHGVLRGPTQVKLIPCVLDLILVSLRA